MERETGFCIGFLSGELNKGQEGLEVGRGELLPGVRRGAARIRGWCLPEAGWRRRLRYVRTYSAEPEAGGSVEA